MAGGPAPCTGVLSSVAASTQTLRDGAVQDYRVLAFGGEPDRLPAGAGSALLIEPPAQT